MKLFKLINKKDDFRTEFNFLGLNLKFFNYKKRIKKLAQELHCLSEGGRYVWQNKDSFSNEDYERLISNLFFEILGYFPNLNNPQTFNEKINWLKLNYVNPLENYCSDKSTLKNYIKDKVGEQFVVPQLGIWDRVIDIDFNSLPNQVVFKNTISGGAAGVIIVKDLLNTNKDELKYKLNRLLFGWQNGIFADSIIPNRKDIKERLIAEKYLQQPDGQLYDYKIFCFNGKPHFIELCCDRFSKNKLDTNFYDLTWKKLPIKTKNNRHSDKIYSKPKNLEKMLELSRRLSEDFPFVRVDLYSVDDKIYVGELTLNPAGGYQQFCYEDDCKYGKFLSIENLKNN